MLEIGISRNSSQKNGCPNEDFLRVCEEVASDRFKNKIHAYRKLVILRKQRFVDIAAGQTEADATSALSRSTTNNSAP